MKPGTRVRVLEPADWRGMTGYLADTVRPVPRRDLVPLVLVETEPGSGRGVWVEATAIEEVP